MAKLTHKELKEIAVNAGVWGEIQQEAQELLSSTVPVLRGVPPTSC